jgi:hypothetical protein
MSSGVEGDLIWVLEPLRLLDLIFHVPDGKYGGPKTYKK